jgi:hypothetical protein
MAFAHGCACRAAVVRRVCWRSPNRGAWDAEELDLFFMGALRRPRGSRRLPPEELPKAASRRVGPAPRVRIAPERSAFFSPRPPRLVGGRVSAPDPGLARGFSPGEVGRVRPSPDPLPALQGSPAVVRGGRRRLKIFIFLPQAGGLSPALPPPPHSITSSARARSVGGIVRPRARAVLRLMTSSNLVGSCTGRSAGLAPLRMRST